MKANRTLSLLSFITLFLSCNAAHYPSIRAIYQFGDSISDTGNALLEYGSCSSPPYGETSFSRPTGRCSDGLLMVDRFAREYKLPLLNPYLSKSGNFNHGVNFAVVGATAMASSSPNNLGVQLGWFKSHLSTICSFPAECRRKLRSALFIVGGIGGNDYSSAISSGKSMQDMYTIAPSVVQAISNAVKEVISVGARRIVVPGSFPVGCMPICMGGFSGDPAAADEYGCLKSWNDLAKFHNLQLQQEIKSLQRQNPGVKIVYGDYFNALITLMQNAASLGFDQNGLHQPCCVGCGSPGGYSCPNPSTRVSWDGIHLTQHAYQFVADQLLHQIRML